MSALESVPHAAATDDAGLVRALRAGDAGAFETLMRRYNRRLYRVARSMLRDAAEAEDAVQEAYLSAFRAAEGFRAQAQVSTWLTRIVVNECMTRMRRSARRNNIVPIVASASQPPDERGDARTDGDDEPADAADGGPERALMRSEMRTLLERRIDALPGDFRTVFMMREVEELSVEETAQCLGIPEATVRSRHFRARGLLRESIAQEIDVAAKGVFDFDGARCDRIVERVLRATMPR